MQKFAVAAALLLSSLAAGPQAPASASTSYQVAGWFSPPVVTLSEYSQIKTGMSYATVVGIIGEQGQEMSRTDMAGYVTVMYMWQNKNGSNMNAMFQNGRLVSKAQFGLK